MKKFFLGFLLFVGIAQAATTVPVQLINPSGSTSGNAIVSTGPSSAPAWSSTINATTLNGATFASPPAAGYGSTTPQPVAATTISATGLITPSTTVGIKGTTAADNAQAGSIGEYLTANSSGASVTSGTPMNATSVSLTAGDWDVSCIVQFIPAASTVFNTTLAGVSTTSATVGSLGTFATAGSAPQGTSGGTNIWQQSPVVRINVSSTTTTYCVGQSSFATSTMTANGFIRARRVR